MSEQQRRCPWPLSQSSPYFVEANSARHTLGFTTPPPAVGRHDGADTRYMHARVPARTHAHARARTRVRGARPRTTRPDDDVDDVDDDGEEDEGDGRTYRNDTETGGKKRACRVIEDGGERGRLVVRRCVILVLQRERRRRRRRLFYSLALPCTIDRIRVGFDRDPKPPGTLFARAVDFV